MLIFHYTLITIFNTICNIIQATIDTISQSEAAKTPHAITITTLTQPLSPTEPFCDFEMMLHKEEEICVIKNNCFIISESNNVVNVETTPNMISRDGANIIDKNLSLLVKYNNLSHKYPSMSNIFNQLQQSANDLMRTNGKSINNNGDMRIDFNDKHRKEGNEENDNDAMTNQLTAEINTRSSENYDFAVTMTVLDQYSNDLSNKCDKVKNGCGELKQQFDINGDTLTSQFQDGEIQLIVMLVIILMMMFSILLFTTKSIKDTFRCKNILENVNLQSGNEVTNLKITLKATAISKYTELITHEINHANSGEYEDVQSSTEIEIKNIRMSLTLGHNIDINFWIVLIFFFYRCAHFLDYNNGSFGDISSYFRNNAHIQWSLGEYRDIALAPLRDNIWRYSPRVHWICTKC